MSIALKNRLPSFASLVQVYSVIAFLVYGWMIYRYAWRLPSWLHYLTVGDLLGLFSYAMLAGLVESLLALGFLLGLSALLPPRFLRDAFTVCGTAISLGWFVSLIVFWIIYERDSLAVENYQVAWTVGTFILTVGLGWLSTRVRWLGAFLSALSDRLIVFLFLIMPLTLIGLTVVLIRNIF
jgi:hypothetical protein